MGILSDSYEIRPDPIGFSRKTGNENVTETLVSGNPIGSHCRNPIGSYRKGTDRKPLSATDKNLSDANRSVPTVGNRSNPILKTMETYQYTIHNAHKYKITIYDNQNCSD